MSKSTDYIVNLRALESGSVGYDYMLEDSFFTGLDQTLISGGTVKAHVSVKAMTYGSFELQISIEGEVIIQCDRCLDDMTQPVESEGKVYVKYGDKYQDDGDELIIVPENEGTIDVSWLMFEVVALALPLQHVHPDGECNAEMMAALQEHMVMEQPESEDEEEQEAPVDERWNDLKKLINNS